MFTRKQRKYKTQEANDKIVESIAQLSAVSEEVTVNTQQAAELSDSNVIQMREAAEKNSGSLKPPEFLHISPYNYFSNLVNKSALISTGRSAKYKSTAQRRESAAFTPVVRVAILASALEASCGIPNKYIL